MRRPAICLNMIVRNEAHIVREVLDAVAPYISSWVIVDTGSDDGTQDVIRDHMTGLGVPGELFARPWLNFGHNRTEALMLAQGRADYIWVMDADDTVTGTPDFTELTADAYGMRLRTDGWMFWRHVLFRNGVPWRYVGVIHEYAVCGQPHTVGRLEGDYCIESRRLGTRDRTGDVDLLLAEIERNPDDARAVLLLAVTYLNLDDYFNTRRWAARRAEMGGWDEEVYFAMLQVAEAMRQLGEPWPQVQEAYMRAWEFRPSRAEPLFGIASWYTAQQQYQQAYEFAKRAAQIPLPEHDSLWINPEIYAWRAAGAQAICAAAIGNHHEASTLCRRLLARSDIPDAARDQIAAVCQAVERLPAS